MYLWRLKVNWFHCVIYEVFKFYVRECVSFESMENNREDIADGVEHDDSTDSEVEELNASVPLDIPPRDIPRHLVRSYSEPQRTGLRRMDHTSRKLAHSPPVLQKQRNRVITQVLPRNAHASQAGEHSADKITLVVDDTRFVVERSLFTAHPNTMLGR